MKQPGPTRATGIGPALIAPCGMNCRLCRAYVRDKKACPGCRGDNDFKAQSCVSCRIKNCLNIVNARAKYCHSGCGSFPCDRLKHLDKRYSIKYGMSMIDNLENIRRLGIRRFVSSEKERWVCPGCGEIICVHKPQCLSCGHKWL
jgi:hypothetical protein